MKQQSQTISFLLRFVVALEVLIYFVAIVETILGLLIVTEKNWREGIKKDKFFAFSETPHYILTSPLTAK